MSEEIVEKLLALSHNGDYANPDGPIAAAQIEALRAKIRVLRLKLNASYEVADRAAMSGGFHAKGAENARAQRDECVAALRKFLSYHENRDDIQAMLDYADAVEMARKALGVISDD